MPLKSSRKKWAQLIYRFYIYNLYIDRLFSTTGSFLDGFDVIRSHRITIKKICLRLNVMSKRSVESHYLIIIIVVFIPFYCCFTFKSKIIVVSIEKLFYIVVYGMVKYTQNMNCNFLSKNEKNKFSECNKTVSRIRIPISFLNLLFSSLCG